MTIVEEIDYLIDGLSSTGATAARRQKAIDDLTAVKTIAQLSPSEIEPVSEGWTRQVLTAREWVADFGGDIEKWWQRDFSVKMNFDRSIVVDWKESQ